MSDDDSDAMSRSRSNSQASEDAFDFSDGSDFSGAVRFFFFSGILFIDTLPLLYRSLPLAVGCQFFFYALSQQSSALLSNFPQEYTEPVYFSVTFSLTFFSPSPLPYTGG